MKDGQKETKDLVAGDYVVVTTNAGNSKQLKIVDRTTKTQVIIGASRYNKTSGIRIGDSVWFRESIEHVTPSMVALLVKEKEKNLAIYHVTKMFKELNLRDWSIEDIHELERFLDK